MTHKVEELFDEVDDVDGLDSSEFQELDQDDLAIIAELTQEEPVEEINNSSIPTKRKKNYLNNADMLHQLKLSLDRGQMTDVFTNMMIMLTEKYASQGKFAGYSYIDDMKSYALLMIVRTWHKFNPAKSSNPFAFFTQCIKHSFFQYLNKEKRQRLIRDELLIFSGLNPSNTYTSAYEHQLTCDRIQEHDSYDSVGSFDSGALNNFD